MDPARWNRIKDIAFRAIELSPGERPSFLDTECGDDAELRREVESLIAASADADRFLASPTLDLRQDWGRIKDLAYQALELHPSDRSALLDRECGDDPEFRREIERLIAGADNASGFLGPPTLPPDIGSAFESGDADEPDDPDEIWVTHIGDYEIRGELGRGGMGQVFLAFDPILEREVALKILPKKFQADPKRLALFRREARMAAQLSHPNIATIYHLEEIEGRWMITMEVVHGSSLSDLLRVRSFALAQVLDIGIQIANGLVEAHTKTEHHPSIIHRDLKPGNVMLTESGHVKILDFGLAKAVGSEDLPVGGEGTALSPGSSLASHSPPMTLPGSFIGTLGYSSPEQMRGEAVDHRSDLFSFGVVLYELLSGKPPFARHPHGRAIASVLESEPDFDGLRPDLAKVIARLLAKKQEDRYQSAQHALDDLEAIRTKISRGIFGRKRVTVPLVLFMILGSSLLISDMRSEDTPEEKLEQLFEGSPPLAGDEFEKAIDEWKRLDPNSPSGSWWGRRIDAETEPARVRLQDEFREALRSPDRVALKTADTESTRRTGGILKDCEWFEASTEWIKSLVDFQALAEDEKKRISKISDEIGVRLDHENLGPQDLKKVDSLIPSFVDERPNQELRDLDDWLIEPLDYALRAHDEQRAVLGEAVEKLVRSNNYEVEDVELLRELIEKNVTGDSDVLRRIADFVRLSELRDRALRMESLEGLKTLRDDEMQPLMSQWNFPTERFGDPVQVRYEKLESARQMQVSTTNAVESFKEKKTDALLGYDGPKAWLDEARTVKTCIDAKMLAEAEERLDRLLEPFQLGTMDLAFHDPAEEIVGGLREQLKEAKIAQEDATIVRECNALALKGDLDELNARFETERCRLGGSRRETLSEIERIVNGMHSEKASLESLEGQLTRVLYFLGVGEPERAAETLEALSEDIPAEVDRFTRGIEQLQSQPVPDDRLIRDKQRLQVRLRMIGSEEDAALEYESMRLGERDPYWTARSGERSAIETLAFEETADSTIHMMQAMLEKEDGEFDRAILRAEAARTARWTEDGISAFLGWDPRTMVLKYQMYQSELRQILAESYLARGEFAESSEMLCMDFGSPSSSARECPILESARLKYLDRVMNDEGAEDQLGCLERCWQARSDRLEADESEPQDEQTRFSLLTELTLTKLRLGDLAGARRASQRLLALRASDESALLLDCRCEILIADPDRKAREVAIDRVIERLGEVSPPTPQITRMRGWYRYLRATAEGTIEDETRDALIEQLGHSAGGAGPEEALAAGWLCEIRGDHERAVELSERALEASFDEPAIFEYFGGYRQFGEEGEGLRSFRAQANELAAAALLKLEKFPECWEAANRAIVYGSTGWLPHICRGIAYLEQRNFNEAKKDFKSAKLNGAPEWALKNSTSRVKGMPTP